MGTYYGTIDCRSSFWSFYISPSHEIYHKKVLLKAYRQFIIIINFATLASIGIIQITNIIALFIMRIIQGVLFGCFISITPVYINEICPKQIVGVLGVFTQLAIVFGTIITYAIGLILTKVNVSPMTFCRVMQSYVAVLLVLQLILVFIDYVPESPNSLIRKNKNEKAKEVIAMFTLPSFV